MKKIVVVFFLFLINFLASAQNSTYTVSKGDSWYSIARKYGISYAELRIANKDSDDKLPIGKKIKIPGKIKSNDPFYEKNKIQVKRRPSASSNEIKVHTVKKSETLFSIAKKYKVTVADLKKWNNLSSNSLAPGRKIRIGAVESKKPATTNFDQKKKDAVIVKVPAETTVVIKDHVQAEKVLVRDKPIELKSDSGKRLQSDKAAQIETKSQIDQENKYVFAKGRIPVNETGVASWIEDKEVNPNKYYALHRLAPLGTIIKMTNRMNSKSIFVKVIGKLPETGDNDGILIKVSKAAAEKLGVLDDRFQVDLLYGIQEKQ